MFRRTILGRTSGTATPSANGYTCLQPSCRLYVHTATSATLCPAGWFLHGCAGLPGRAANGYERLFFINRDNNDSVTKTRKIALQDPV